MTTGTGAAVAEGAAPKGYPPLGAGRRPAGLALLHWLADERAPRLCRVSGGPGSGKTHLVRWLATACTGPGTLPERRIHAVLAAAGGTVHSAVWQLAAQLRVAARTPGELVAALRHDPRRTVLCVRDLDRAGGAALPQEPGRIVAELLDPLLTLPQMRVVADAADGTTAADAFTAVPEPAVLDLDDPQWTDRVRYARWYGAQAGSRSAHGHHAAFPSPGLGLLAARIGGERVDRGPSAPALEPAELAASWWHSVPGALRPAVAALRAAPRPLTLEEWVLLPGSGGSAAVRAAAALLPPVESAPPRWWLATWPALTTVTAPGWDDPAGHAAGADATEARATTAPTAAGDVTVPDGGQASADRSTDEALPTGAGAAAGDVGSATSAPPTVTAGANGANGANGARTGTREADGAATNNGPAGSPADGGATRNGGTDGSPADGGATRNGGTDGSPADGGATRNGGTDGSPADGAATRNGGTAGSPADGPATGSGTTGPAVGGAGAGDGSAGIDAGALLTAMARSVPRTDGGAPDLAAAAPERLTLVLECALAAGRSEQLLHDPVFLVHADPVGVTAALTAVPEAVPAALAVAWREAGPALVVARDPGERAAVLRARLLGRDPAATRALTAVAAPWSAQWALWAAVPLTAAAVGSGPIGDRLLFADASGALHTVAPDDGGALGSLAPVEPGPLRALACTDEGTVLLLDEAGAVRTTDGEPVDLGGSAATALAVVPGRGATDPAFGDATGAVHCEGRTAALHGAPVTALGAALLPAGGPARPPVPVLLSGAADGTARLWSPGAEPGPVLDARDAAVTAAALSATASGVRAAVAWSDGLVRVRELTYDQVVDLRLGTPAWSLVFTPAGLLAVVLPDGVAALRVLP